MSVRRRRVKERIERDKKHDEMLKRWSDSLEDRRVMLLSIATEYRSRCPEHEIDTIDRIIGDLQPTT